MLSRSSTGIDFSLQREFVRSTFLIITGPDPRGIIHVGDHEHQYWLSWKSRDLKNAQKTWLEAKETCERFCMQLVSIEGPDENVMVSDHVQKGQVYGAWTGGLKCQEDGCMDPDGDVNWVWQPIRRFLHTTFAFWSGTGGLSMNQPDNLTGNEGCLAILNNWYGDGTAWHDLECEDRMPFICEDRSE